MGAAGTTEGGHTEGWGGDRQTVRQTHRGVTRGTDCEVGLVAVAAVDDVDDAEPGGAATDRQTDGQTEKGRQTTDRHKDRQSDHKTGLRYPTHSLTHTHTHTHTHSPW